MNTEDTTTTTKADYDPNLSIDVSTTTVSFPDNVKIWRIEWSKLKLETQKWDSKQTKNDVNNNLSRCNNDRQKSNKFSSWPYEQTRPKQWTQQTMNQTDIK